MTKKIAAAVLGLLGVPAVVAFVLVLVAGPAGDSPPCLRRQTRPLVIAHQGGDGLWPGNTLYAFERAAAMGTDMLEMDLRVTADGAPVLMHDPTVDRTTDGRGRVAEMTLAQIKVLDAGYRWTPDGGRTFPYRGWGITVPTLEELFQSLPDMPMNVEIKRMEAVPTAESLCRLIRRYGMQDRVLVASFHQDAIDAFRAACPEVATSASRREVTRLLVRRIVGLGSIYSPPAQAVQVPESRGVIRILTPRFVRTVQGRGLDVHVWTVNETADMQRMIDLGVDGIVTDYPDRLLALLGRPAGGRQIGALGQKAQGGAGTRAGCGPSGRFYRLISRRKLSIRKGLKVVPFSLPRMSTICSRGLGSL